MYRIEFDDASRTLSVTVRDFWTEETRSAFKAEYRNLFQACRRSGVPFKLFVDATDFMVQSGSTVTEIAALHLEGARAERAPTAIVVGSVLLRKQVERAIVGDNIRVFPDRAAAVDWLGRQ